MARRTPPEQQEYRPVNEQLARSVLARRHPESAESQQTVAKLESPPPAPSPETREQLDAPSKAAPEAKPADRADNANGNQKDQSTDEKPAKPKRKDLVREKRMLLTESEEEDLDQLVKGISAELGIRVKSSNVLRACLSLLLHVEPELRKQCKRYGKLGKRPSNNEPTQIATFEESLARLFDGAIRNTKSLD